MAGQQERDPRDLTVRDANRISFQEFQHILEVELAAIQASESQFNNLTI